MIRLFWNKIVVIRSFKGIIIISIEDLHAFARVFISEHQLPWPNCQAHCICFRSGVVATYCFKGNGFSVHNTSYLVRIRYSLDSYYFETDYFEAAAAISLKQLLFCNKNFFTTLTYLEQLILFNRYFLVTNISSNQLLFEDKSFFSRNTALEKLLLQNK